MIGDEEYLSYKKLDFLLYIYALRLLLSALGTHPTLADRHHTSRRALAHLRPFARRPPSSPSSAPRMDWSVVHKLWEKWAPENVGHDGQPIKQAVLINYDPTGPSRLLSTIAEQAGTKADPIEINQFVSFVKRNKLQTETFMLGPNEYLVTSIHGKWFHARCINTAKTSGEGVVVMQTEAFLLVAIYEGSIGAASCAVAAADHLASQLSRKNL